MSPNTPATTPVKKTMTWNEQTDKQLLMAIMAQLDYKYDSALVAAKASSDLSTVIRVLLTFYNQFGPWCTPRAVEERVKRLKKQAKAENHPTSPLCPGQSTKTEAKMQALRAADIEAFHNHSAEKQTATQAAVTTAAETTPTKASKATATKATPASRAKKGTATRVKKGKGKAVDVADEDEPMAESSDAAVSSAMKREFSDDTEGAGSDGATISTKKVREYVDAVDQSPFLA